MSDFKDVDITALGGDEILMYDPVMNNATKLQTNYAVRMYDRLAAEKTEKTSLQGNPWPGSPISSGTWSGAAYLQNQIVYIGDGHVMFSDFTNGRYWIRKYNRVDFGPEADIVSVEPVAEGQWEDRKQMVWTYVGDDVMMSFQPYTCEWSMWTINRNARGSQDPLPDSNFLGSGSWCAPAKCWSDPMSCPPIVRIQGCGWCDDKTHPTNGALGNKDGPCFSPPCKTWYFEYCPSAPCETHQTCSACVEDPFCGWCMSDTRCHEGDKNDPAFRTCEEWRHF